MKWRVERSDTPIPVLETGATAHSSVVSGALVPVIMVDVDEHGALAELIRAHEHVSGGDCLSSWVFLPSRRNKLGLRLVFERPVHLDIVLVFTLPGQAGAVDQVMRARALYLQHGSEGHGLKHHIDEPRIFIEVLTENFADIWEGIFLRAAAKQARSEGASYPESRRIAPQFVAEWRRLFDNRMRE